MVERTGIDDTRWDLRSGVNSTRKHARQRWRQQGGQWWNCHMGTARKDMSGGEEGTLRGGRMVDEGCRNMSARVAWRIAGDRVAETSLHLQADSHLHAALAGSRLGRRRTPGGRARSAPSSRERPQLRERVSPSTTPPPQQRTGVVIERAAREIGREGERSLPAESACPCST